MVSIDLFVQRSDGPSGTPRISVILAQTLLPRIIGIDSDFARSAVILCCIARRHIGQRQPVHFQDVQAARKHGRGVLLVVDARELAGKLLVDVVGESLVAYLTMQLGQWTTSSHLINCAFF
jgi:hypothetical protein